MSKPRRWEMIYNTRTEKEQVTEIEYYRALLLLAGVPYTAEFEIKNGYHGYSSDPIYCQPWLMIMTKWGAVKIGWRKRVINIDWRDSNYPDALVEPPESWITHDKGFIHCYGYEQAITALKGMMARFERLDYFASMKDDSDKQAAEIERIAQIERDEKKRKREHEIEQARKLIAEVDGIRVEVVTRES